MHRPDWYKVCPASVLETIDGLVGSTLLDISRVASLMILTEDPSATLRNDLGVGQPPCLQPHGNSIHSVREERRHQYQSHLFIMPAAVKL